MHRRTLLGSLGIFGIPSLAGCVGTQPPTGKEEATPASTVSLNAQDTIPPQYNFDITVEVIQSEFTEEHPGVIQITTTNTGSPIALSISSEYCSIFNKSKGGSDDPSGLWLYRPESAENIDRKKGRWVADKPPDEPRGSANVGCTTQEYQQGQSVTSRYQVWDDYQTEGYLKPGTYRWETDIGMADSSSKTDRSGELISWGFSLTLEN